VGACCAGQDIRDARAAAEALGIAHYVLDYESRFREQVIDDFADSYLRGETPIPCIRCNQTVKFRDLREVAQDLGAQALVTGHYVQRIDGAHGPELHRAVDPARDQSWFLFATTRDQLDFLRFPLGSLPKPQVRALAAELGLGVADKPDSQDICFVPEATGEGEVVHEDGRVLGRHEGVSRYTVGQRRGLNLGLHDALFVTGLDAANRRVVVGPRASLLAGALTVGEENWLGDEASLEAACESGRAVLARVRSTREPVPARLATGGRVLFEIPHEGVSPGQACVLYDPAAPTRVLGGGFIRATERAVPDPRVGRSVATPEVAA
jgi:tRNA-specific 2-thiouridylase